MPSPEAIERRRERDRIKSRKRKAVKRAAKREVAVAAVQWRDGHLSKMLKRKLLPKQPEMSKSELRAMLQTAFKNTVGM